MLRSDRHSLSSRLCNSLPGILFLFEIHHTMLGFFPSTVSQLFQYHLLNITVAIAFELPPLSCLHCYIYMVLLWAFFCCANLSDYDLIDCSRILPFIPERAYPPYCSSSEWYCLFSHVSCSR